MRFGDAVFRAGAPIVSIAVMLGICMGSVVGALAAASPSPESTGDPVLDAALALLAPEEERALLWVHPQGNLGGSVAVEAVILDDEDGSDFTRHSKSERLSKRCRESLRDAAATRGARWVLCLEESPLYQQTRGVGEEP